MELKNIITKLRISTERFNIRLEQAENKIRELKDRSFKIKSKEQKE